VGLHYPYQARLVRSIDCFFLKLSHCYQYLFALCVIEILYTSFSFPSLRDSSPELQFVAHAKGLFFIFIVVFFWTAKKIVKRVGVFFRHKFHCFDAFACTDLFLLQMYFTRLQILYNTSNLSIAFFLQPAQFLYVFVIPYAFF